MRPDVDISGSLNASRRSRYEWCVMNGHLFNTGGIETEGSASDEDGRRRLLELWNGFPIECCMRGVQRENTII